MNNSNKNGDTSLNDSSVIYRSFYSSPNIGSPKKKTFIIKSKLVNTISPSQSVSKTHSFSNLSDLESKLTVSKDKPKNTKPNVHFITKKPVKLTSLQNIPAAASKKIKLPQKPQKPQKMLSLTELNQKKLANLKPVNKHLPIIVKPSPKRVEKDEEDEKFAVNKILFANIEERKEEEEISPMVKIIRNSLKTLMSDNPNKYKEFYDNFQINYEDKHFSDPHLAKLIETSFTRKAEWINLKGNTVGPSSLKILNIYLTKPDLELISLKLDNCNLLSDYFNPILESLKNLKNLKILSLCENLLNDQSSPLIKILLMEYSNLKELYLRKNRFSGLGGANIAQGLLLNNELKILDLSWNMMSYSQCAAAFVKVFQKKDCSLVHVDFSFNNFSLRDCEIFQQGINKNNSLYGFHFEGNFGFIDEWGFLQIPPYAKRINVPYDESRQIKGLCSAKPLKVQNDNDEEGCCWLCEKWYETLFELSMDQFSDIEVAKVFIHLDCCNFEAIPMIQNDSSKFILSKILPRKRVYFFFTVNQMQLLSEKYYTKSNPNPNIHDLKIGQLIIPEIQIYELNYLDLPTETKNIDNPLNSYDFTYNSGFTAPIRDDPISIRSLFKVPIVKYKFDEDYLISNLYSGTNNNIQICFEQDWQNAKLFRFLNDQSENENFKKLLINFYPEIKEIYHYLSALAPISNVFCVSQPVFGEFARNTGIVDEKFIKVSDVDLTFFTSFQPLSKMQSENAKSNKYLIRCQFIEALIKLSIERFVKSGIVGNVIKSTEKIFKDLVFPTFEHIENKKWVENRLKIEKTDFIIKKHWSILENVYNIYMNKKNAGKINPNYNNGLIGFKEFQMIFTDSELISQKFSEREINVAFRLSVGFYPEDLSNDSRNLQLNYPEFIEAIARSAERLCLLPFGETSFEIWTENKRNLLPLYIKIESLINVLFKKCCDKKFQENYAGKMNYTSFEKEITQFSAVKIEEKGQKTNSNKKNILEKKTFMRQHLQNAINLAILYNKVNKNKEKSEFIDTPYH